VNRSIYPKKDRIVNLKSIFLVYLISIFFIIPVFFITPALSQPPNMFNIDPADEVDVYLKFNSSIQRADVSPCGSGLVYFDGVVQVRFPEHYPRPPTEINVTLTSKDTWNTSKVTPEFLIFTENGEKPINVSVCAPKGESRNIVGLVQIKGYWVSNSAGLMGETRPDTLQGRIDINPFYNFSVCCSKERF
jgi:hypothetical protein